MYTTNHACGVRKLSAENDVVDGYKDKLDEITQYSDNEEADECHEGICGEFGVVGLLTLA